MSTVATSAAGRSTLDARPSTPLVRYLFRDTSGTWRTASTIGLETGLRKITGEIHALTFDAAIDLAHHYRDQADAAERLGYPVADEQWSTWAEQLEIWAARRVGAPGRVSASQDLASGPDRTVTITVRHGRFDGDEPTFAEMVGHHGGER